MYTMVIFRILLYKLEEILYNLNFGTNTLTFQEIKAFKRYNTVACLQIPIGSI